MPLCLRPTIDLFQPNLHREDESRLSRCRWRWSQQQRVHAPISATGLAGQSNDSRRSEVGTQLQVQSCRAKTQKLRRVFGIRVRETNPWLGCDQKYRVAFWTTANRSGILDLIEPSRGSILQGHDCSSSFLCAFRQSLDRCCRILHRAY